MKKLLLLILLIILLQYKNDSIAQLQLEQAFPNLTFQQPVDIQNAGDGSDRLFVVEQRGIISVFPNNSSASSKKTFLDISGKVASGGEMGLLGLAFHPKYKSNGYFYVNYTVASPSRRTIISRFKVSGNPDAADTASELILLQIDQPYSNHNGGQTSFGPDGYLYISLGDGGSGGDPQNYAQNLKSLLGKILRIDVDKADAGKNYSIPEDNPFKGSSSGFREEIYAYGLRNVWRFSFDSLTKELWAADVGQNAWEEINIIQKGGNYGWRCFEGFHPFNTNGCSSTYLSPIFEYAHNSDGGYSITGGFVYRGKSVPELYGKYIYADFVTSHIWALDYKDGEASNSLLFRQAHPVSTFGVDEKNELYFTNYNSGKIYRIKSRISSRTGKVDLPDGFQLYQNYPNPFNPGTIIKFILAKPSYTKLTLYDSLSRKIAVLVNEFKQEGVHTVAFKPDDYNLVSGVYFYSLIVGEFKETKRMLVLK